jgi:16S rRNA processing protein RimM
VSTPLIRTARVRRPHGVAGEVRVESLGGDARRFRRGLRLSVEAAPRSAPAAAIRAGALPERLTVRSARALGDGDLLLSFMEIGTPEAAGHLRGCYLSVPVEGARCLAGGEWFVWQLVGLAAVDAGGAPLGRVSDVESGSAQDVLVVEGPGGERRFPMVAAFVREVDLAAGRMVLTPWEEDDDGPRRRAGSPAR